MTTPAPCLAVARTTTKTPASPVSSQARAIRLTTGLRGFFYGVNAQADALGRQQASIVVGAGRQEMVAYEVQKDETHGGSTPPVTKALRHADTEAKPEISTGHST